METCDDNGKAAYIYDHEWSPDHRAGGENGRAPLIHLIVWAQPKTAALRALIDIMNRALALRLGMIIGKPSATQLLDVQVIDDQAVSRRSGYAALLTWPRYRPAQLWKRRAVVEHLRQLLSQVQAARERLAAGVYGICTDCECPIPAERLAALPYATLCVHCQSRREKSKGARLGLAAPVPR